MTVATLSWRSHTVTASKKC